MSATRRHRLEALFRVLCYYAARIVNLAGCDGRHEAALGLLVGEFHALEAAIAELRFRWGMRDVELGGGA